MYLSERRRWRRRRPCSVLQCQGALEEQRGTTQLVLIDVKREYFYAKTKRAVLMQLPPERVQPCMCGRISVSLCGARDSAQNVEADYRHVIMSLSRTPGIASPCAFYRKEKERRLVDRGDDFAVLAAEPDLRRLAGLMELTI